MMDQVETPPYLEQIYSIEQQKKSELQSLKRQLNKILKQTAKGHDDGKKDEAGSEKDGKS
jgi:hypothetical protein